MGSNGEKVENRMGVERYASGKEGWKEERRNLGRPVKPREHHVD